MTQIHMMALRHSAFYTPYLMTIAGGYLRDEGLEPVYTVETPQCTVAESMRQGRCHVAQSAVATSFAALERGESVAIAHFAQINVRDGFFIAARKPDPAFRWEKLKGRRVLVDHFFQPLAMLKYGLHRVGVDYAEIKAVDAGDVAAIERIFRDGQGDYVHMQGPVPQQLAQEGLAHVVAAVGDAVGPVAFSSICAPRSWLETDMAHAFMRAYRRALEFAIDAPAEELAARLAAAGFFLDIDPPVLSSTVAAYQRLRCWQRDPAISPASYDNLLDVFLFSGAITRRHDYAGAVVAPPG